jgi:hypothetical protein
MAKTPVRGQKQRFTTWREPESGRASRKIKITKQGFCEKLRFESLKRCFKSSSSRN